MIYGMYFFKILHYYIHTDSLQIFCDLQEQLFYADNNSFEPVRVIYVNNLISNYLKIK